MKLNLTITNTTEERIKKYLEQNASPTLAEKINNGTPIERDGQKLVNRKTLSGFMNYATIKARELAEKGARFACVADDTVFGWAIHYFEEDSIIGELFTADGTPYKPTKTPEKAPQKPKTEAPEQMSMLTEETTQTPKKAVILPIPDTKPTEAYPSIPKPTEKPKKKTDPTQISFYDLF